MASRCEKKTMQINPGMNHLSMRANSMPVWRRALAQSEKRIMSRMNSPAILALIRKEEEAMADFSACSSLLLT